ncbi:hypothetical protein WBG78_20970 [Chryseolinea sp. T2]|uniref:hypothetical protein n=1 Tax=Chryseolinea sp. T2 TaxID=3129255 RepID=UPI0030785908
MKTKIALGAIAMSIASFSASAFPKNPTAEEAGKKIFAAFQHSAFMEYNSMVPTLTDLYQVMEANASFYGANLSEAKAELSKQYANDVKKIETSFLSAIEQGKLNHISWAKAKFVSAERSHGNLVIEFTVDGTSHKVQVAVAEIEGELRAGNVIACL